MRLLTLALSTWLLGSAVAGAQTAPGPPLTRADVHGSIGWQNLRDPQAFSGDDWINAFALGGAAAGIYWTDHLRTQVDVAAGTRADHYRPQPVVVGGTQTFTSSNLDLRERSVAVSQQYQFFRNAWFHPHLGAGVAFVAQQRTETFQPVIGFDSITRQSRVISPARVEGPETRWIARPFADIGYKGYLSRRAFFVNDARIAARGGIAEFQLRFGFGVDF